MSEFTNTSVARIDTLNRYMIGIIEGIHGAKLVNDLGLKADHFIPNDVLSTFDLLFDANINLEKMKMASNKLFNILYETLISYPAIEPKANSFIHYLIKDNAKANLRLKALKPLIKQINKEKSEKTISDLQAAFKDLEKFTWHYTVKENILFPLLEKQWKEHDCLKLMWSFHDDIRQNIKKIQAVLNEDQFDIKGFNTLAGLLFFNISTIIFREEKILFPIMMETIDEGEQQLMLQELSEMKLPYVAIEIKSEKLANAVDTDYLIKMPTGEFSIEQAELIFNHLPVDITFVDENETVRFFSTPKHRIFPRTAAIIGRKVQNCHPPESVGTVTRIVQSFKNGEKDVASFWLHMGPKFVLIQYFAIRDKQNKYRGVLEVSQEISEIQSLKGDRKLLDW